MAILSRVSQRALWLRRRRISSMPVSTGVGAEVPGKPRKHHGVGQSFSIPLPPNVTEPVRATIPVQNGARLSWDRSIAILLRQMQRNALLVCF